MGITFSLILDLWNIIPQVSEVFAYQRKKPLKGNPHPFTSYLNDVYFFANGLFPPHIRTIGLATKIEEYVPTITPIIMANEKSCSTSPPKKNRATDVRRTVVEVIIVLDKTSLILLFITVSILSLCFNFRFSLLLSNTTTVSVRE